jgi:hypothetical protein
MNGIDIKPSDSAVHLGVTRSGIKEVELNIEKRIKCARRTKYGLLRTGFHGTNGIDPITAYQMYKTYVLLNCRVVFPDVSSFSFSVQYFFMVEFTRFFHFGFGVHEFLAAHRFPVFFLYCRKRFLYCHNSPKFASIPLL